MSMWSRFFKGSQEPNETERKAESEEPSNGLGKHANVNTQKETRENGRAQTRADNTEIGWGTPNPAPQPTANGSERPASAATSNGAAAPRPATRNPEAGARPASASSTVYVQSTKAAPTTGATASAARIDPRREIAVDHVNLRPNATSTVTPETRSPAATASKATVNRAENTRTEATRPEGSRPEITRTDNTRPELSQRLAAARTDMRTGQGQLRIGTGPANAAAAVAASRTAAVGAARKPAPAAERQQPAAQAQTQAQPQSQPRAVEASPNKDKGAKPKNEPAGDLFQLFGGDSSGIDSDLDASFDALTRPSDPGAAKPAAAAETSDVHDRASLAETFEPLAALHLRVSALAKDRCGS